MLRLRVPPGERLHDARSFQVDVGGAELNALIAMSACGVDGTFVTKLPSGALGRRVASHAAAFGVSTHALEESGGRLGTYYVDPGGVPRGTEVIYDRAGSSFSRLKPGEIPWGLVLAGASMFHVSGITLALGGGPASVAAEAVAVAKQAGIPVSFDINYRAKLWSRQTAAEAVQALLPDVDLLFGSAYDLDGLLGEPGDPESAAARVRDRFHLDLVILSERQSLASGRSQSRVMAVGETMETSHLVEAEVLDPIGAGDALAGVFLAERLRRSPLREALDRAATASAFQQTLLGDAMRADREELSTSEDRRAVRR